MATRLDWHCSGDLPVTLSLYGPGCGFEDDLFCDLPRDQSVARCPVVACVLLVSFCSLKGRDVQKGSSRSIKKMILHTGIFPGFVYHGSIEDSKKKRTNLFELLFVWQHAWKTLNGRTELLQVLLIAELQVG